MAATQRLHRYSEVCALLGFKGNEPLNRALKRFDIRPIEINSRVKRLSDEMVELLLSRASEGQR